MDKEQLSAGVWMQTFLALAAIVVFGLSFVARANRPAGIQNAQRQEVDVLEGLDPVMLVQGKEAQGDLKTSVTRGQFRYLFSTEENKALFEKDPTRYEIQLNGQCARMGSARGNPDLFAVYKGRIYIFGSVECKKAFQLAPANYLESENPPPSVLTPTPEALRKGSALIEKAVQALGGASRIDGITSYQEKSISSRKTDQGEVQGKMALTIVFPDKFRRDETRQDTFSVVLTPGDGFYEYRQRAGTLGEEERADQARQFIRNPLSILRDRKRPTFKAAALGPGKTGDTDVERVAVEFDGLTVTLNLDAASGRMVSLSYRGRGTDGVLGEIEHRYSDFRTVEGVTLPYKTNVTLKGEPMRAVAVDAITLNAPVPPALFERPKSDGAK